MASTFLWVLLGDFIPDLFRPISPEHHPSLGGRRPHMLPFSTHYSFVSADDVPSAVWNTCLRNEPDLWRCLESEEVLALTVGLKIHQAHIQLNQMSFIRQPSERAEY